MTDAEDPKDNSEESAASNVPEHNDGAGGPESEAASPEDQAKSDAASPDLEEDELPEEEELTPELVEEEAIRGDFMLRWATIFLAVLFGFSQMADTKTLVHIRSGENLRANGFLPSGQDSLSYAAEDKVTANISWLFDHVVSAVYAAAGAEGLTLFKALVAGLIAYLLSQISTRGMPTWWNSICCVFAISACSVDFLPITDLATLTGLAITLLLMQRHDEENETGIAWKLPFLIAVWANLDPRAYLGVFAIALFAFGSKLRQSRSLSAGDTPGASVSALWKAAAFSFLALLVNPAPINSLFSVIATYSVEYPTMAAMLPVGPNAVMDGRTENFSIWAAETSSGFEFAYVAGMAIILITLVVLYIGRSRHDLPWATTFVGFTLLAGLALHELPAASLVAAATAGLAAQRWYGRTFRQEYSVAQSELLFSRGGRAVTVLGFAALAFFVVTDRLPTRTPVGFGFETDLNSTMTSLKHELAALPEDARILNTRLSQGDLLVWHGRKSFVDSRSRMFGRFEDENSLMHRFNSLRRCLVPKKEATPEESSTQPGQLPANELPEFHWLEESDGLDISHVMIRLTPPGPPPYSMVLGMLRTPKWQIASRGPSAVFFRNMESGETTKPGFDIREEAFRTEAPEERDVSRFEFAREKDFYQRFIYGSRTTRSAANRSARHYFTIDSQFPEEAIRNAAAEATRDPDNPMFARLLGEVLAGPLQSVRKANEAVKANPQDAESYRLLGLAYRQLSLYEAAIAESFGGTGPSSLRYNQSVMALQQSATIDPENPDTWSVLSTIYREKRQTDLALETLTRFLDLIQKQPFEARVENEQQIAEMTKFRQALADSAEQAKTQLESILNAESQPQNPQQDAQQKLLMAQRLYSQGHVRLALGLINENLDLMRGLPASEVLRGTLMMAAGELEDGYMVLNQVADFIRTESERPELAQVQWHIPLATINLGLGNYREAKSIIEERLELLAKVESETPQLRQVFFDALPLQTADKPSGVLPQWPIGSVQAAQLPMSGIPRSKAEPLFTMAMIDLEAGRLDDAETLLRRIITECGGTPQTALAAIYLKQLSDDADDSIANMTMNPWESFTFSENEAEPVSETPAAETPSEAGDATEATASESNTGKPGDSGPQEKDAPKSEPIEPGDEEADKN